MTNPDVDRRTVLRGIGTVAIAGALAGCGGGGGDGGGDGGSDGDSGGGGDGGSDGDSDETPTPTPTQSDGGSGGSVPSEVESWLSDTSNFSGVTDMTGQDPVTVQVGAEGNNGNFAFSPAAIRVDAGTEVVWEWTGKGADHNVVDKAGNFESKLVSTEGHTYSQTFDSSGTVLYFCRPHKGLGMKGAIIVE